MASDLTEDALVASCPGDVGLVSWVHYRMDRRIKELEQQLKNGKPKLYRHLKTGGIYEFITDAEMESNLEDVVVYRSVEHKSVWVRPSSEFYDGRFEQYASQLEQGDG